MKTIVNEPSITAIDDAVGVDRGLVFRGLVVRNFSSEIAERITLYEFRTFCLGGRLFPPAQSFQESVYIKSVDFQRFWFVVGGVLFRGRSRFCLGFTHGRDFEDACVVSSAASAHPKLDVKCQKGCWQEAWLMGLNVLQD